MAYFPDLSPYSYGGLRKDVVNVGWLDGVHPFARGKVERPLIEKMRSLASMPVELCFGRHLCELCAPPPGVAMTFTVLEPYGVKMVDPEGAWTKWAERRWSNGEIRVTGDGVVFAAPVLIVHYVEEHGYLPPAQFLEAVAKAE